MSDLNSESTERLNAVLNTIDDKNLAESLFTQFYLLNPLEYARLLRSLSLPNAVESRLLSLRVEMPPAYEGTDLAPLIDKAMQMMWTRLADDARGLHLG